MQVWLPVGQKPLPGQVVDWDRWGMPRPVADWRFNDPNGSPILSDDSGNGNHGTLISMDPATDWVYTARGSGLDFNAAPPINDYVAVAGNPYLQFQLGNFTMHAIVTPRASAEHYYVLKLNAAETNYTACLAYYASALRCSLYDGVRNPSAAGQDITLGTSYSVTGTWESPLLTVYTTNLSTGAEQSGTATQTGMTFGAANVSGIQLGTRALGDYLDGIIERALIFREAFTAQQVQALQGPVPIWTPQRYWWVSAGGETSEADELVVAMLATANDGGTWSETTDWSERGADSGGRSHLVDKRLTAIGTPQASFGWTTATNYAAALVTYPIAPGQLKTALRTVAAWGKALEEASRSLATWGADPQVATRQAEAVGAEPLEALRPLASFGSEETAASRATEAYGTEEQAASRALVTHGSEGQAIERALAAWGADGVASERGLSASGRELIEALRTLAAFAQSDAVAERQIVLVGAVTEAALRTLSAFGTEGATAERTLEIYGAQEQAALRALAAWAAEQAVATRGLDVWGEAPGAVEAFRTIETWATETLAATRAAEVWGAQSIGATRNAEAWGVDPVSAIRGAEMWGVESVNAVRGIEAAGIETLSILRALNIYGLEQVVTARDLAAYASAVAGSTRGLEVWGAIIGGAILPMLNPRHHRTGPSLSGVR